MPPAPSLLQRAVILAELAVFFLMVVLLDELLHEAGLRIDPGAIDGVALMGVTLVRTPLILAAIAVSQGLRGSRLRDLGLSRPAQGCLRACLAGVLVTAILLPGAVMLTLALERLGAPFARGVFDVGGLASRLGFLVTIVVGAALGEELVFRGYLFQRFQAAFAGLAAARWTRLAAAVACSLPFALTHAYQGEGAMVAVFAIGLFFCAVVRACDGLLLPAMVAHFLYDCIGLFLAPGSPEAALAAARG